MTKLEAIAFFMDMDECTYGGSEPIQMAIEALKKEIGHGRDCKHCSKIYGTFGCCHTVSNKWVYSCKEGQREYLLNKIKAEIEELDGGYVIGDYGIYGENSPKYVRLCDVLQIIDKYKA